MYVTTTLPATPMLPRIQTPTCPWEFRQMGIFAILRIQAHRKFDRIWKCGIMTRENAYRWFADSLGLSLRDAHIGMCGEYRCRELIKLCDEVLARNHRIA